MIDEVFKTTDLVLGLDVQDWERPTTRLISTTRTRVSKMAGLQVHRHRFW